MTHYPINVDENRGVVYESPDNGHTVYVREFGSSERVLVSEDDTARDLRGQLRDNQLWADIRRAAKNNPALNNALEHAKSIYLLGRTDE